MYLRCARHLKVQGIAAGNKTHELCPHEAHMETQLDQKVNHSMIEMVLRAQEITKVGKGDWTGEAGTRGWSPICQDGG